MRTPATWLPVVTLLALSACPPASKTEKLVLSPSVLSLQAGEARVVSGRVQVVEDGTESALSGATWASSDEAVATVAANADGTATVTAVAPGSATITASLRAATATVSVVVTAKPRTLTRLELTPPAPSLAAGTSLQLTATGIFSDDSREDLSGTVTWSTSSDATVGVSPAGRLLGRVAGTATITAARGSVTASVTVTVTAAVLASLEVTPPTATVARGLSVTLAATGVFSDNSTQALTSQVTWSSTDSAVATVSSAGVVTGVAVGTVTIRAERDGVTGQASVTVGAAELVSLEVTPAAPSLPRGATLQLTATGRFSDSTTQDLTAQVTWSSSSSVVLEVSDATATKGLATARAQGAADAIATLGGLSARTSVSVTGAVLSRIDVTPAAPSLAKGRTAALTATGVYTDGATADLTTAVLWSSTNAAVVSVSNAQGSAGEARAVAEGSATVTATQGAVMGSTTVTVTAAELASLAVTPATASVALGLTQDFTATGTFTDGATQDLTTQVTWASGTPATGTVSNATGSNGRFTSLATGTTTVSATSGSVVGSAAVTVVAAQLVSLELTPAAPTVSKGLTQALVATGRYTDNSTQTLTSSATWASATSAVATVTTSGTRGVVTAVAVGSSVITATVGSVSGSTTVTVTAAALVSLAVTPAAPTVAKGLAQPFTATGTYTDGSTADVTDQVSWTSGTPATATIGNTAGTHGVATTLAEGTSTITASQGSVSGTATLTVGPAALVSIAVTGAPSALRRGDTAQLTATATYTDGSSAPVTATASWSSSASGTASVSDASGTKGLVTGVAVGGATITAAVGAVNGTASVTVVPPDLVSLAVTPATPSLAVGLAQDFVATGSYSDGTTANITSTVTWSSSDAAVATVSNTAGTNGRATAVAEGTATITATLGSVSGNTVLTVTALAVSSIAISPAGDRTVVEGLGFTLTATATYTDNSTADVTQTASWASSNMAVAVVSNSAPNKGQVTTFATGVSTIMVSLGGANRTLTLMVVPKSITGITVAPATPSVAKGRTQAFTATATYDNATSGDVTSSVTWSSGTTTVATISTAGVASTLAEGTSVITATSGTVSGTATLTVTAAELVSLALTGLPSPFRKGDTASLVATGTYTDATTQVLTGTATWASSATSFATVSDAAGTKGQLAGVAVGSANITATVGAVVGTLAVTVAAPSLVSIAVTPATPSVNVGATLQLTATGTFSDSSTQDVSGTATWTSATTTVATVNSSGLVTGVAAGTSGVDATIGSVTGSTTVTVVNPPPTVTATSPADAATGVTTLTSISVTFSRAMSPATLTVQSAAGACTGSLQVSRNDFASCIALGAPAMSSGDTVARVTPVAALADASTYKVRVTTAAQSALGAAMAATFTQPAGFATRGAAACGSSVVISQVYGGGGSTTGSPSYRNDFIELHNPTAGAIDVSGWAVQYGSATGTGNWAGATPFPASTIIPPGGYLLIQGAGSTLGAVLPTPDVTGSLALSAASGKVALTNNTTLLNGANPSSTAIVDLVGYGTANGSEVAPTGVLNNTTAALRRNAGCGDANNNATDFDVLTPAPRNSVTTPSLCACSLNGLGPNTAEADYCVLQFPTTTTVAATGTTEFLFGRLYEASVTEAAGAAAQVRAQVGFGPLTVNPQSQAGWSWFDATYNLQVGNDDEYQRTLTAPGSSGAGTYGYAVRFSVDGLNWTYCDADGSGSNSGLSFDPAQVGVMTVTP